MDPISNQIFSHDYLKYVLQDPNVRIVERVLPPSTKPFEIKPSEKTKKDLKKKKSQDEKKET